MGEVRRATSRAETLALGVGLAVLGGSLTFVWIQGTGRYPAALPVPTWVPAALTLLAGVALSLLRLELPSATGVLIVVLPLSYAVYMLLVLSPQLLAGWAINDLLLIFTYGAGGQGFLAWLVSFPMVFVAGFGTHLVADELING
ncbi:hypothetical protein Hbl1158_11090 [Halobaculum sp. CBA1158]|uniref:hypothetical protein n=1 Tax=Halobaculum sp. CBA1158 TaxID=2904243 RepID=UPI001F158A1F|nr:hypothetical protein [Halobaculum sp. CBA1158]UIO99075.1 hypothetical protein Hbl1158_11090 [Halobaculum sp. CBA1158]